MILFWERKSSSFDQQKPKAFCHFQIAMQVKGQSYTNKLTNKMYYKITGHLELTSELKT